MADSKHTPDITEQLVLLERMFTAEGCEDADADGLHRLAFDADLLTRHEETCRMATAEIARLREVNAALLEALKETAALARFELDHQTELRDTSFSLIEKRSRAAISLATGGGNG